MVELIIGIIGTITGVGGMICALVVASRNKKKDDKTEGKEDGVILTELGYIKSGIDDIKHKQEEQEKQNLDFVKHLTAVEESTKQAHKRIDKLEKYHQPNWEGK